MKHFKNLNIDFRTQTCGGNKLYQGRRYPQSKSYEERMTRPSLSQGTGPASCYKIVCCAIILGPYLLFQQVMMLIKLQPGT